MNQYTFLIAAMKGGSHIAHVFTVDTWGETEVEARRNIIHEQMRLGWHVTNIELEKTTTN